ncbi:unnamed protein product [Pleuronectes platessa]|uniref:Uncharacterized protein n=1 Tax=Pleuronectes platessa TaxID=8262 RepID=A0A9N7YUU3_PLEPL|nr:unnamed protein product [Pleuronectes platessa]
MKKKGRRGESQSRVMMQRDRSFPPSAVSQPSEQSSLCASDLLYSSLLAYGYWPQRGLELSVRGPLAEELDWKRLCEEEELVRDEWKEENGMKCHIGLICISIATSFAFSQQEVVPGYGDESLRVPNCLQMTILNSRCVDAYPSEGLIAPVLLQVAGRALNAFSESPRDSLRSKTRLLPIIPHLLSSSSLIFGLSYAPGSSSLCNPGYDFRALGDGSEDDIKPATPPLSPLVSISEVSLSAVWPVNVLPSRPSSPVVGSDSFARWSV